MILGKKRIIELMKNGLVENMVDANVQIQAHGIDLTIGDVLIPWEKGVIDFDNSNRHVSGLHRIPPTCDDFYHLTKDRIYVIKLRERVNIPKNIVALTRSRPSMHRSCAYTESAIWEAGYSGIGYVILHVGNPYGLDLATNAKICQMIFIEADEETEGYSGIYQYENI